jgi:hypothetical protein
MSKMSIGFISLFAVLVGLGASLTWALVVDIFRLNDNLFVVGAAFFFSVVLVGWMVGVVGFNRDRRCKLAVGIGTPFIMLVCVSAWIFVFS